jgi:transposase
VKNSVVKKVRQVPAGYLVVGVDPHKKRHAAVVITQDFAVHGKFKFNNSREGFMMTLERVRVEMTKTGSRGVIFAIETGGHYWRNLAYFLDEVGIPFRFINQFTLKRVLVSLLRPNCSREYMPNFVLPTMRIAG